MDWWYGDGPLIHNFPGTHYFNNTKLSSIITTTGTWDLSSISQIVDIATIDGIVALNLSLFSISPDYPTWVGASNGAFTVGTAYNITNPASSTTSEWTWIWKLKIPSKLKFFLWIVLHNSLPTNSLRVRRGMIPMDYCPRCDETPEDINHIFRTCPKAVDFWKCLRHHHWLSASLNLPVKDWIIFNSKKKTPFRLDVNMPWAMVFVVLLW